MNILLISQCSGAALAETRRILDQFAERFGDGAWQTPVTQAGLDTLRRLLRKSARKNTAVACHWIRGQNHRELLWIVGDARRFSAEGTVPTATTRRNVLRRESENDWHTAEDIRLLAQLAALLHDLGKVSISFQKRLRGRVQGRNLYRHEWVSLRLFQAFVGEDDDEGWLRRLMDPEAFDEHLWTAPGRYQRDGLDATRRYPFRDLPPLAAAVAWLVVTHHRLPVVPVDKADGSQDWLGKRAPGFSRVWMDTPLALVAHDWNEVRQACPAAEIEPYWQLAGALPIAGPRWRRQAARVASHLLELRRRRDGNWLGNPYVMHLARLGLMLADHHYSSLPPDSAQRVRGDAAGDVYANSDHDGNLKQPLGEHLLGVARDAGHIAHALPGFERYLPRLANHRGLRRRSADPRFSWQDKAADAAASLRESARERGAFIVNMASTGCGKTLANARILNALADPQQGLRATYALGLRSLTLQTGHAYRDELHLGDEHLAVRVGGSASRALFEYYEHKAEVEGSASTQSLVEEDSQILYEGVVADHPLLSRALHDDNIRNLLSAPILVCTVDHLVPATESTRAGRQIAPMLRLMSADLVLDEIDDYDLNDLPAISRLVHWAGMLGTRVVLSSATLPPALVEGLFLAYQSGRVHYARNRGSGGPRTELIEIPCLWTDEFGVHSTTCAESAGFVAQHVSFVDKRSAKLEKAEPLRRADLVPVEVVGNPNSQAIRAEFARHVRDACLRLHADHAEVDPVSGKRISFGLVRMANIDPLFDVARALIKQGAPEGTCIHLCVYHARFPSVARSAIEHQLDSAFNRRGGRGVCHLPAMRSAIDSRREADHVFVVLASPVCEVGRDWDADWAVAEPSSMRSLIQLAGRVQRHRRKSGDRPNMLVFDRNLRALERQHPASSEGPPLAFVRPGFERDEVDSHRFRLRSARLSKLLLPQEYRVLTALPRIRPRAEAEWATRERLADLEQARMAAAILPRSRMPAAVAPAEGATMGRDEAAWCWMFPQAALTGVLPQQQPFREDAQPTETMVALPDDEGEQLLWHRVEDKSAQHSAKLYVPDDRRIHVLNIESGPRIVPWGHFDLLSLLRELADHLELPLEECAEKFASVELPESVQGWSWHPWLGFRRPQ